MLIVLWVYKVDILLKNIFKNHWTSIMIVYTHLNAFFILVPPNTAITIVIFKITEKFLKLNLSLALGVSVERVKYLVNLRQKNLGSSLPVLLTLWLLYNVQWHTFDMSLVNQFLFFKIGCHGTVCGEGRALWK